MLNVIRQSRLLCAAVSVLLAVSAGLGDEPARAVNESGPILRFQRGAVDAPVGESPPQFPTDVAIEPANHEAASPADPRQLAPPSPGTQLQKRDGPLVAEQRANPFALPQIESLTTAVGGLAIVVGLFLLCMTLLRRSGPRPTSPLPREAVAVLGRVPLAARNFAHLLQVGNKLVLVAITPDGVSPITEVTEPAEVQRLLGLCRSGSRESTTAEFQQVMQKIAAEPAKGFLGKEATATYARARR